MVPLALCTRLVNQSNRNLYANYNFALSPPPNRLAEQQGGGMAFPSQVAGVGQAFLAIERGDRQVARQGQAINSLPVAEAAREAKPKFYLDSALPAIPGGN